MTSSRLGELRRAANSGSLRWQPLLAELVERIDAQPPARRAMIDNSPWPDFWCAPGFVAKLQRACAGSVVGVRPKVKVAAVAAAAAAHKFVKENIAQALACKLQRWLRSALRFLPLHLPGR